MDSNALVKIENLLRENKKTEALSEYKSIMANAEPRHDLWSNYASFLFRCGQNAEAVAIAQKSISIKPTAEAFHNLGCALTPLGKSTEAIDAFKMALHLNFDLYQSHNGISNVYESIGDYVRAIDHLQIATTLMPANQEQWIGLARLRLSAGRSREALSALRTARKLDNKNPNLWIMYGKVFKHLNDFEINNTLLYELTTALNNPSISPEDIVNIIQGIFLQQIVVKCLLENTENYRINNLPSLFVDKGINWGALNHDIFVNTPARLTFMNNDIETFMTTLRFHALESLQEKPQNFPYFRELFPFLCSLACQCFINEYLYFESEDEKRAIELLEEKIVTQFPIVSNFEIVLYACYKPLHKLKNAADILHKFKSEISMTFLLKQQITEPLREMEIKDNLKTITPIEDDTSIIVKKQYEENPFPRWVHCSVPAQKDIKVILKFLFPYLTDNHFQHININAPKTLIAGCGTGKQSIETALQLPSSKILAFDLSAASLAYAIRKTKEFKLENIDYGIGDILNVGNINEKFDIITCGGVLHHMKNPIAGWRALTDALKPGGFMMIALYSEIARKPVTLARNFIADKGFKSDAEGIRTCREELKLLPDHHPIKSVSRCADFYSTSAFRDFVFHVQESRFTALTIKQALKDLGLTFLGFQLSDPTLLKRYCAIYPDDPHGLILENWDSFERQHPEIFLSMYQFWVQKPAD